MAYRVIKTKLLWIKVALFSCYIEKYVHFLPSSDNLGSMAAFDHLRSAFEKHGFRVPVNTYKCKRTKFKDDICTEYFPKVHANSPLHRQIKLHIQIKRSGVGVEEVRSIPTPIPTPDSLPRLWDTLTPTPHP